MGVVLELLGVQQLRDEFGVGVGEWDYQEVDVAMRLFLRHRGVHFDALAQLLDELQDFFDDEFELLVRESFDRYV